MTRIRTYKNYTLLYDAHREDGGYLFSIEKSGNSGIEKSTYFVHGSEHEFNDLLFRLWRSGVTPMSLVYILEDEGYIPREVDNETGEIKPLVHIVKRRQKKFVPETDSPLAFLPKNFASIGNEPEGKDK